MSQDYLALATRSGRVFITTDPTRIDSTRDDPVAVACDPSAVGDSPVAFTRSGYCFRIPWANLGTDARFLQGTRLEKVCGFRPADPLVTVLPPSGDPDSTIFFAYASGTVKRTLWSDFKSATSAGIAAAKPADDFDRVVSVATCSDDDDILLVGTRGKAIRFASTDIRPMGRTATGVRGVSLAEEAEVAAALVLVGDEAQQQILVVNTTGAAKRVSAQEIPRKRRAGQGVTLTRADSRYGVPAHVLSVEDETELWVHARDGRLRHRRASEVPLCTRSVVPRPWLVATRAQAVLRPR